MGNKRTGKAKPPKHHGSSAEKEFQILLEMVFSATQLDVSQYREATLRRQIENRYRSLHLDSLVTYLAYVKANEAELVALQHQFLISVTSFFRDQEPYQVLDTCLRNLIGRKRAGDSIRIWVPGCATGEEAYSIAIVLTQALGHRKDLEIRVFGTDIDEVATETARAGIYAAENLEGVSPEIRSRWFVPENGHFRIAKEIRELCVFSQHDIIRHPPFIRIDLISCRNLLIYFKASLQEALFRNFHYALLPEGLLLLGKSETVGPSSKLFETLDGKNKLFRRKPAPHSFPRPVGHRMPGALPKCPPPQADEAKSLAPIASLQNLLSASYVPPSVAVSPTFEIIHFFGDARRFFSIPHGNADFSLFSLIHPELRDEIKALCYRALHEPSGPVIGLPLDLTVSKATAPIRLVVRKVPNTMGSGEFCLLISFEELFPLPSSPGRPTGDAVTMPDEAVMEIARLRQELAEAREHLQLAIGELESSHVELQVLNEEMQSSAEELQSSNEELQSSNEELTTLNEELRVKSLALTEANATLSNIQDAIHTSLIVVDGECRVTRFNGQAVRVFGLLPGDIGQKLMGIPCHLPLPHLRDQLRKVITTGTPIIERVRNGEYHFLMQIAPYFSEPNHPTGAVLNFTDISELHRAEEALNASGERYRRLVELSPDALFVNRHNRVEYVNPAALELFGAQHPDQVVGKSPFDLFHPDCHDLVRARIKALKEGLSVPLIEEKIRRLDGTVRLVEVSASPFQDREGDAIQVVLRDVTRQRQVEEAARKRDAQFRLLFENMLDGYAYCRLLYENDVPVDFEYIEVNAAFEKLTGLHDVIGRKVTEIIPGILTTNPELLDIYGRVAATGIPEHFEGYLAQLKAWLSISVYSTERGGFVAVFDNISTQKREQLERETTIDFLKIVNQCRGLHELVEAAVGFFREKSGCEAVGIRIKDGEDFPYFESRGFPAHFLLQENSLCTRDKSGAVLRDQAGYPIHECMCGNVICGRVDPSKPFFSPGGSFWTNNTTQLLASTTEADRQTRTRNRCNGEGYESVALLPLRISGESLGLLQLNDRKPDMFDPATIALWERLAGYLAVAVAKLKTEEALQVSEANFQRLVDFAPLPMCFVDAEQRVKFFNRRFEQVFGYSHQQLPTLDEGWKLAFPDETYRNWVRQAWMGAVDSARRNKTDISPLELFATDAKGVVRTVEVWGMIIGNGFLAVFLDLTEKLRLQHERNDLQDQLFQAQKMESIGRLAGGVAHDFNNMLGVILGNIELASLTVPSDSPVCPHLDEILKVTKRSAELTRQLLAFARRQTVVPKMVNLNSAIEGILKMLGRLIGENLTLQWTPGKELWPVHIDPSQVDQLLANLVVNARDAITGPGSISIRTENTTTPPLESDVFSEVLPGEYVLLQISDTGCGMDPVTLRHVFEPFFTTKPVGRGTGLGLATVYGIVKQNGGFIEVDSRPTVGTTFRLLFPRFVPATVERETDQPAPASFRGWETLLVVEDELPLLRLLKTMLEKLGFTVMAANSPKEALKIAKAFPETIHLLITDVVMPEMDGQKLSEEIADLKPGIKCLFISGYPAEVIVQQSVLKQGYHLLQKPFSQESLGAAVGEILGKMPAPE